MAKSNLINKEKLAVTLQFRCSKQALKTIKKHTSKAHSITVSDVLRHLITLLNDDKKET
jgi:hypothetical protein